MLENPKWKYNIKKSINPSISSGGRLTLRLAATKIKRLGGLAGQLSFIGQLSGGDRTPKSAKININFSTIMLLKSVLNFQEKIILVSVFYIGFNIESGKFFLTIKTPTTGETKKKKEELNSKENTRKKNTEEESTGTSTSYPSCPSSEKKKGRERRVLLF